MNHNFTNNSNTNSNNSNSNNSKCCSDVKLSWGQRAALSLTLTSLVTVTSCRNAFLKQVCVTCGTTVVIQDCVTLTS